jgi:diguanylate cyclase (GGDEF)-like protein
MVSEYQDDAGDTLQASAVREASQGTPERRPALIFLRGDLLAVPIPLERDSVVLGRAVEADVRVNDFRASRLHARITAEREPGSDAVSYKITDLRSTNGTQVNGHVVNEAYLNDGDKVLIGDHLFRFEMLDEIDREFQQHIHRLLAHDELTGLLTSKSFFSELKRESAYAEEDARPFCVLMMDLDFFKRVNDSYGHLVGSQTLEEIGVLIKKGLRAGDVASRFGGEEFAAFLLDADYAQAMVAAERVRSSIEQHEFSAVRKGSSGELRGEVKTHRLTISIGVAAFPEDSRDPIELIELADSALYRAKRNGRNRTCAYHYDPPVIERILPPRRT